ncbi:ABC transporter permease [Streptomyces sp. CA-294286]|uniref:ABC transporter permease n=1 Tax=Streptomyces sp. CA-294286 TaxID=3240070 RepID=UPI003D9363F3
MILRQHRWAPWAAVALVATAAVVTVCGLWWQGGGRSGGGTGWYASRLLRFSQEHGGTLLALLPLALGAFVAGPLIARELESGTYKLAWTQSVSPARWLAVKLALPLVVTALATSALVGLFRLGRTALQRDPYGVPESWYGRGTYEALGPAVVGYAVLGVALGALIGLLVRRTAPAMGATACAVGCVLLTLGSVRAHLWPPLTVAGPADMTVNMRVDGPGVWELAAGWRTASGDVLDPETCFRRVEETAQTYQACMTSRGATERFADFHPQSHFWPLQLVETGILLALAALAGWLAFRVLRRIHG